MFARAASWALERKKWFSVWRHDQCIRAQFPPGCGQLECSRKIGKWHRGFWTQTSAPTTARSIVDAVAQKVDKGMVDFGCFLAQLAMLWWTIVILQCKQLWQRHGSQKRTRHQQGSVHFAHHTTGCVKAQVSKIPVPYSITPGKGIAQIFNVTCWC